MLCLGTPKVFASVDGRTRASVTRQLQGASEETKELALRVRALLELCVTPPLEIDGLLSWECTEDALAARLASRDPTGLGVHSKWALRLIGRLLSWDPERRPTAEQALTHAYFRGEGPEGVPFGASGTGGNTISSFEAIVSTIARRRRPARRRRRRDLRSRRRRAMAGLRDVRVVVSSELYKYLSGFRGARGKDTKAVARSVVALFSCRRRRYEGTRVSWNVVHVNIVYS